MVQLCQHVDIQREKGPNVINEVHIHMLKHTHTHTAWTQACDYDKPCCLLRSSPRLWERMGRNAKETRRSQAYSFAVGVEGGGAREEGWMLLTTPHNSLSPSPFLSQHPFSLQRPHVCQPSSGAFLLSILPIFVVSPAVFLALLFSSFLLYVFFCFYILLLLNMFFSRGVTDKNINSQAYSVMHTEIRREPNWRRCNRGQELYDELQIL